MKPAVIRTLTDTFEGHAQQTEGGVEYWLARDLQHLLGYTEWRNFQAVLHKARTACEVSGHAVSDHFVAVNKMVDVDFAPTIVLKAKDFATEITIHNTREQQLRSEGAISAEHITNNEAVRHTLLSRGIRPEELPAAEDVKRVERRLHSDEKASLTNPESLGAPDGAE